MKFLKTPLQSSKQIRYSVMALSKISKLALVGYISKGAYRPLRTFFMRYFSMRSHVMAKLERDTFECAGNLLSLSTNPLQLCHLNYLVVIGRASKSKGAH